jgi:transcription termination factor NusB
MGGGALPVAYNKKNKKVYLLFGKENEYLNKDSPGWSDFGGGEKPGESALDTALREGCEELNGFFGCEGDIKRLVKDNLVKSLNHERYTTFLFQIDYDENLPVYFNNNYKFLKSHVNNLVRHSTNGLFEKSDIKWMTFDDLRKERGTFRSYYRNVVDVILENEEDITSKLLQNKKRRKRATSTAATATTRATGVTATRDTKATHKTRRYNNYKYSDISKTTTATTATPLSKPKPKPKTKKKSKKRNEKTKTEPASNWFSW